ncbi:hypothetical protein AB0J86_31125 [Micromonospora sp. NPDC049559]|uniref:hypothetical protein n=1 Tax=Micromonospora sp. NPDC049559 TaxID=3155923 RepID=UPI0034369311
MFPAAAVAAGYQLVGYPGVPCGFLVAGVATWYVGRRINRDPEDGHGYHNDHTFFSIPMQYWAVLWLFFALAQVGNMLLGRAWQ